MSLKTLNKINSFFVFSTDNIIFILILLLPLSFFFGSLITNFIVLFIFFIFFFKIKKFRQFSFFHSNELKVIIFFCLFLTINTIYNGGNIEKIIKSIFYLRFPILTLVFFYCFKFISKEKKFYWINFNILCLALISLDLLVQYFNSTNIFGFSAGMCGERYLNDKLICTRYAGFFNDELILGGYYSIISLSIILFINSIKKNWTLITLFMIFILYLLIMITGERSATITILLTFFFIFLQYKIKFKIKLMSVSILIILTTLMITLNPHIKGRYIDFFSHDMNKNNQLSKYQKILTTPWGLHAQKSLKLFLNKPLTGHGLKSFRNKCDHVSLYFDRSEKKHKACSTHPHNLILELLVEQGIIGFTLFILFFLMLFKKSFLTNGFFNSNLSLIGLRSLVFVLIFVPKPSGSIFSTVNATMIWFCISLLIYQIYSKKKNEI